MRDTKGRGWDRIKGREKGLEEVVRVGHVVKVRGIRSGAGGQGRGSGDGQGGARRWRWSEGSG